MFNTEDYLQMYKTLQLLTKHIKI